VPELAEADFQPTAGPAVHPASPSAQSRFQGA
jgi:hypothetical protein